MEEIKRFTEDEALSMTQPAEHWHWMRKLVAVAEAAKASLSDINDDGMPIEGIKQALADLEAAE